MLPRARCLLRGSASSLRAFSSGDPFRILAPTAILGYGFPKASFDAALERAPVDLLAVDAGSVDPGPYYLASRSSFTSLPHVLRDLRIMLEGFFKLRESRPCKLVVGSAGGCGSDNQVDILVKEVLAMCKEMGQGSTLVARVTSELNDAEVLRGRELKALGPMPDVDAVEAAKRSVVVAQMGLEPIMCALEHADVLVCGRAYDPAVFAAEPVRQGYPAAMALHAAKVLECGAIACVPGSGSDCLVAELDKEGPATFWAPNVSRKATALSVAAHTLYEKSHPHCFGLPGGVLNTTRTRFEPKGEVALEVSGSRLARVAPAVKLEGAAVRGHRAVGVTVLPPGSRSKVEKAFVYGVDGVEATAVKEGEQELGLLVEVAGGGLARNKAHLALLRATLLHFGFEGRKSTAGNLAFPFSPSDLVAQDGAVLTVCGTRDPGFIANYEAILRDAEAYVATLSKPDGLNVRIVPCGLPQLPLLEVEESVGETLEAAKQGLIGKQEWLCDGGFAADYTLHHLLPLDDALMREIFKIELLSSEGAAKTVPARLVPWGEGEVVSQEEAYADWELSKKPAGTALAKRPLQEMAKVVRSKNAGVNELTYDIIFGEREQYDMAKASPALDAERLQPLLGGRRVLGVYCDDISLAIKITCDRGLLAGSAGDRDVYGAQQQRSLLDLTV